MVARTRSEPTPLAVRFESDGEPPEVELVNGGERALTVAITLLGRRQALRLGDKLAVVEPEAVIEFP